MKQKLEFRETKDIKGLTIFCNQCKNEIHRNVTVNNKCTHPIEKQVYKAIVIIPNSGGRRRTKNLIAITFDEAIIEFLKFRKEINNQHVSFQNPDTSEYLTDNILMYLDYMQDINIPHHRMKYRGKDYLKSTESFFNDFKKFIQLKKIEINDFKIYDIDDALVGEYCKYTEDKKGSNYTFNHKIKCLRTFFNYLIKKKEYTIKNVWDGVTLKSEKPTNISISYQDFCDLLAVIKKDDSSVKIGKTRRIMYKYWLKDVVQLKAFTGRRNQELFAMKWNMIKYEDGIPLYIESPNVKVNRLQNNFEEKDYQFAYIPVGSELLELLNKLNLNVNKDNDNYILAPEVGNRETLEDQASKCFSFYAKKLGRPYPLRLKYLRQTYITSEALYFNDFGMTMQHSRYGTTSKHYIDKKTIVRRMVELGFRVFPESEETTLQK
jgi:hypothetical protein